MRSLSCKGIHFDKFFLAFSKGADEATLNTALRVVSPAESKTLHIHKNAKDDVDAVCFGPIPHAEWWKGMPDGHLRRD